MHEARYAPYGDDRSFAPVGGKGKGGGGKKGFGGGKGYYDSSFGGKGGKGRMAGGGTRPPRHTVPCRSWVAMGDCRRGAACGFKHGDTPGAQFPPAGAAAAGGVTPAHLMGLPSADLPQDVATAAAVALATGHPQASDLQAHLPAEVLQYFSTVAQQILGGNAAGGAAGAGGQAAAAAASAAAAAAGGAGAYHGRGELPGQHHPNRHYNPQQQDGGVEAAAYNSHGQHQRAPHHGQHASGLPQQEYEYGYGGGGYQGHHGRAQRASLLPKAQVLCRFYSKTGRCEKGAECEWKHIEPSNPLPPKQEVLCRYMQRGECHKGDQCEWSHGADAAEGVAGAATAGNLPPQVLQQEDEAQ